MCARYVPFPLPQLVWFSFSVKILRPKGEEEEKDSVFEKKPGRNSFFVVSPNIVSS